MTQRRFSCASALGLFCALFSLTQPASATDRRFAFTYESGVLAPGNAELESWTTVRSGRPHHFVAFDQRLELELGLLPNLQTSVYWNFASQAQSVLDEATNTRFRETSSGLQSISSEWKYKFSDALADSLGSAGYVEASYGPSEAEIEAKLILDKQSNNLLLAANLEASQEWEMEPTETNSEQKFTLSLAGGYFITPSLIVGLEALSTSTLVEGGTLETSTIYVGPTLGYAAEHYWFVVSAIPQVFAPKAESGDTLDLDHGEHVWMRALLGFHL